MIKRAFAVLQAALLIFVFASCENAMVIYLLGEKEEKPKQAEMGPVAPVPVALWNNVWYNSLAEAVQAAAVPLPIRKKFLSVLILPGKWLWAPWALPFLREPLSA